MIRLDLRPGDGVRVDLPYAGEVILVDDVNLRRMRRGQRYERYGGYYRRTPVVLRPQKGGRWYLVVNTGGRHRFRYQVV